MQDSLSKTSIHSHPSLIAEMEYLNSRISSLSTIHELYRNFIQNYSPNKYTQGTEKYSHVMMTDMMVNGDEELKYKNAVRIDLTNSSTTS